MKTEPALRALVVDDEPLGRERLRTLLADDPEVEIVGECADGRGAVEAVRDLAPDLVFLDVQMPLLDGFGVVSEVGADAMPPVIFVTAYDEYAIRAFEARAVDYLLKPFDDERFRRALAHVRRRLREARSDRLRRRLQALLEHDPTENADPESGGDAHPVIPVHRGGRIVLVEVPRIDWIEAAGDYVRLHVSENTYLLRSSMADVEERVGAGFLRIHRSTIVRKDAVKELAARTHGDYDVVLGDGTRLRLSRTYRRQAAEALGIEL